MNNEKKCPHCGQWTTWHKSLDDRCQYCNTLLQERQVKENEARQTKELEVKEHDFFRTRPDDGLAMKAVRKTAFVAHVIYAAIVWLFLMMFASTPG